MTEAVVEIDLGKFEALVDKKVKLTYVLDGEEIVAEGTLMAVAAGRGAMFRKRGSQAPLTLTEDQLRDVEAIAEAPKKVTAKKLKAVTLDEARAHLADRHGYTLKSVNDATPEQAMLAHQQIDHTDLGHTHDDGTAPAATSE